MQSLPLSEHSRQLAESLSQPSPPPPSPGDTFHVEGVGARLYFAYEQIRNAAEYGEQHLLLRRAIERFLKRMARLDHFQPIGSELVIEMTQSRYLKNDTISRETVKKIDETMRDFSRLYEGIVKSKSANRLLADKWVLQVASIHLEQLLVPQTRIRAFVDFAYKHYLSSIKASEVSSADRDTYDLAVYCAVHRSILKSDIATVRAYALASGIGRRSHTDETGYFVKINQKVDDLYSAPITNRLVRLINQYGAPMRVLREIMVNNPDVSKLMENRLALHAQVRNVTQQQYHLIRERLNNGIVRSIAFVAITKILIGVALEVPYDIVRHGEIIWQPLILNIIFPPLYMATLGLGIRPPSRKNTELIVQYADRILYQTSKPDLTYRLKRRVTSPGLNRVFNFIYGITFIATLSMLGYILSMLGFTIVSAIIFFVFLSTVSFLGFRLTQTARELELIEARRSVFSLISDFFYTPFIRIGYWLSDKYAKINVVSRALDVLIEMPLKFVLRFVGQWVGFLRDKQEDL